MNPDPRRSAGRRRGPFGHAAEELRFWRTLVKRAMRRHRTPFYLFSVKPVRAALDQLRVLGRDLPARHWLSFKTQPVRPLVAWWRREGRDVEVVSEFELRAALKEGFAPDRILVNGPAKQAWLRQYGAPGLRVNFDSLNEVRALAGVAKQRAWRVGVRIHTAQEFDPEYPGCPTQFGMQPDEARGAIRVLRRSGLRPEVAHFHLRTNVATPACYGRALDDVAGVCRSAGFSPDYLDCGGGLPPPHVLAPDGRRVDAAFELRELARVQRLALRAFPDARELWMENGRFLSARSGVLVVRVLDVKARGGLRQLICDGGRTLHALISTWESHGLVVVPGRRGPLRLTSVCGPTCMAFDRVARRRLPETIRPGDLLAWLDAGAYHVPWETRFSHGYARVLWHDGARLQVAREPERFEGWWGQWK